MIDILELLKPIPGDDPGGISLLYEGTHDRLMEARREEDPSLPMGVWDRPLKEASWSEVIGIGTDTLINKSKDLRTSVIFVEAMLIRDSYDGFKLGLGFLNKLLDDYWENMHPKLIDDEDLENRMLIFEWFAQKTSVAVQFQQLTAPVTSIESYNYFDWLKVDKLYKAPKKRQSKRERELNSSERLAFPSIAGYENSLINTPTNWLRDNFGDVVECSQLTTTLDEKLTTLMGKSAPNLRPLHSALDGINVKTKILLDQRELQERALKEQDHEEHRLQNMESENNANSPTSGVQTADTSQQTTNESEATTLMQDQLPPARTHFSSGTPRSRDEAYEALAKITTYLLEREPHSPTPYLLRRAVSFKDMTLADMITSFVDDDWQRTNLLKLMGMEMPSARNVKKD